MTVAPPLEVLAPVTVNTPVPVLASAVLAVESPLLSLIEPPKLVLWPTPPTRNVAVLA